MQIALYLLVLFVIVVFFKTIRIVPEQEAWIVEEFGKFKKKLGPGLHIVIPFVQKIAYQINLKEEVIDVKPQICITRDNVQVTVDGILYLKVMDPVKACYGIENYRYATAQLTQTTMRSEVGKIELDNSFSERDEINNEVVKSVDEASDPWGIKVTRYEIRDLDPPSTVREAMERQMTAEREKRAEILKSEGVRQANINHSEGEKEEAINLSKGDRQKKINEADGKARAIELVAEATAEGIEEIALALNKPSGQSAMSMRIAQQYVEQLGEIFSSTDISVLPLEEAQTRSFLETVAPILKKGGLK